MQHEVNIQLIIQKDVSFQASSIFLSYDEQTKAELAKLERKLNIRQTELQEHRINARRGNVKTSWFQSERTTECYSVL